MLDRRHFSAGYRHSDPPPHGTEMYPAAIALSSSVSSLSSRHQSDHCSRVPIPHKSASTAASGS